MPAIAVEVEAGRASVATLIGAVDSALASEVAGIAVRVLLAADDSRREALKLLCAADARVGFAEPDTGHPEADLVVVMPATARPEPRTLPQIAELARSENVGTVHVPVPGRLGPLSGARLEARGTGSGTRRLRAADVSLRSTASRREAGPPPAQGLAAERAEHLRHRARSSTMRAQMDRNSHRLSRERLQVRHENARLRLAEQRLARTGPLKRVSWVAKVLARRVASVPKVIASGLQSARVFLRRARRHALDRWRSRGAED